MSKFRIGDEVAATKRCRERWGSNDFGNGMGVVVEYPYPIPEDCSWVKWDGGGMYYYNSELLELDKLEENE